MNTSFMNTTFVDMTFAHIKLRSGLLALVLTIAVGVVASASATAAGAANRAYVVNTADSSVMEVDLSTLKVMRSVKVGNDPYYVAVSGDHKTLAVTVEGEQMIKFFDTKTLSFKGQHKFGVLNADHMMTLPDGKTLIVADRTQNAVVFIDFDSMDEVGRVNDVNAPHNIRISLDGNYACVTSKLNPGITVIDLSTRTKKSFFPVEVIPRGLAFSPDNRTIFFGGRWVVGMFSLDVATGEVSLIEARPPHGIRELQSSSYHSFESVNDSLVLGANEGYSSLDLFNTRTRKVVARYEGAKGPSTVINVPGDPNLFAISNSDDNTLEMVQITPQMTLVSRGKIQVGPKSGNTRAKRFCFASE